jgi:hypothetical protein
LEDSMDLQTLATAAEDWAGPSAIANWVYALSTTAIAVAAAVGISAWRRQLRGQDDFKIAKDLLRAVYNFRDAIRRVRFGWIAASEWESRPGRPQGQLHSDADDLAFAFQTRWKGVTDAGAVLQTARIEAEVAWGQDALFGATAQLIDVRTRLLIRLRRYLGLQRFRGQLPIEQSDRIEADVFEDTPGPDDLTSRLTAAVTAFEAVARPHLYADRSGFLSGLKHFAAVLERRIDEETGKSG